MAFRKSAMVRGLSGFYPGGFRHQTAVAGNQRVYSVAFLPLLFGLLRFSYGEMTIAAGTAGIAQTVLNVLRRPLIIQTAFNAANVILNGAACSLFIYSILLSGFTLLVWSWINWTSMDLARFATFFLAGAVTATWKIRLPELLSIAAVSALMQSVWRPKIPPMVNLRPGF